uniref:Uncharacterized protein n=1 Tax=Romanomermis culicivorax TaxID=13658 RepID=A0A915L449_ROMCU
MGLEKVCYENLKTDDGCESDAHGMHKWTLNLTVQLLTTHGPMINIIFFDTKRRLFILAFPTEQNAIDGTEVSVLFGWTLLPVVSRKIADPFRLKVNFQAERFKLLTIRSVPSEKA